MTRIVIIGGGPAGYEAALVAAQLGAQVTVIERDGIGGASVLTDCVPSKTLIAAAGAMTVGARLRRPRAAGRRAGDREPGPRRRSTTGSRAWPWRSRPTSTPGSRTRACGSSPARAGSPTTSAAWPRTASRCWTTTGTVTEELESDVVLIATGADPRVLPRRRARRRADPRLARRLRPRGDARAPGRRRLRRDRRRVRLRLPGGRRAGHPRLLPRPGAARGGLRRRRGGRGGLPVPRRADRRARPRRRRHAAPRRASSSS